MTKLEKLLYINEMLLNDMPEYKEQAEEFPENYVEQRRLLRSLMNVRHPMPLHQEFLQIQDEFLREEVEEKGVVSPANLMPTQANNNVYLWKGDITTLQVDAIVNAANAALLGCFIPCHRCIDNAIHSVAGLQLRQECNAIMNKQGHEEETGKAKLTQGYNLPSRYVIHTVGPIIYNELTKEACELLASCYRECLEIALEHKLQTIAFCCISTGEFRFPNQQAAEIAVKTVTDFMNKTESEIEVIFNVFKQEDYQIYRELLGEDCENTELHS